MGIKEEIEAARRFVSDHGVTIINNIQLKDKGCWESGRVIEVNPNLETSPYVVLHEYAHCAIGPQCCKEHAEIMAHGGALALMASLGMEIDEHTRQMGADYFGRNVQHGSCRYMNPDGTWKADHPYYAKTAVDGKKEEPPAE